jgi:NAD-dependent dihydropyrimidine dehydrogenase PreA subunit
MTMYIQAEACTGCGVCVAACPPGAIRLIEGKAVIDGTLCNLCEACVSVCPVNAITVTALPVPVNPGPVQPVIISSTLPTTSPSPQSVTAWAGAALAFVGREVAPRLADALVAALERRLTRVTSQANRSSRQSASSGRPGRAYRLRKRKRSS